MLSFNDAQMIVNEQFWGRETRVGRVGGTGREEESRAGVRRTSHCDRWSLVTAASTRKSFDGQKLHKSIFGHRLPVQKRRKNCFFSLT